MPSSPTMLLRVGTIGLSKRAGRKPSTLLQAGGHNLRAEQSERGARAHINPAQSDRNQILRGPDTPAKVAALAQSLMAEAGIDAARLRRDYAQALELLVSLPPESGVNESGFFDAAVKWAGERFGMGNILSAVVHRDEAAPHCHILVLPLVGGKMAGSALVTREATSTMTREFFQKVAKPFGLRQPERSNPAHRADLARAVLDRLNVTSDPCQKSAIWATLRAAIESNPQPFAEVLGVTVTERKKPMRTFTQIMTSTGKKTSEDRERKPIGFEGGTDDMKPIGFGGSKTPKPILCRFRSPSPPQITPEPRPGHAPTAAEPAPAADHQHPGTDTQQEAIGTIGELWNRVGVKLPPWQVQRVPAVPHSQTDQPRAIESLAELWEVVGRRVVHSPSLHRDRLPPAERLELARAAQERAIARHARRAAPVLADHAGAAVGLEDREDGRVVDREHCHDLTGWQD